MKRLAAAAAFLVLAPAGAAAADDPLAALRAGCANHKSTDAKPVAYRMCTADVATFDGTELDTTLTLPVRVRRGARLPLVVFLHGFLSNKGEYISESAGGTGPDRGPAASYKTVDFNNVWFASRGYAVLTYSARGQGDSKGQVALASKDFEVRDTQYLTGLLADEGKLVRIDPRKVAAIGGSYGGGQTWLLLTTRRDPKLQYGEWRSPKGRLVRLAAAIPGFTWTDLLYSLAPNGHQTTFRAIDEANADTPFGVGKQTLVNGFLAIGGTKFTPQLATWLARFNAGEPYDNPSDPVVPDAKRELLVNRSPYFQDGFFTALRRHRQRRVPVLAAQGWTDPIFPAIEVVRMYDRIRAADPRYPLGIYMGDFEHLTSLARVSEFRYWHRLANALLDRYLRGRRTRVSFDVRSALSNCDPKRFGPVVRVKTWKRLASGSRSFDLAGDQGTASPISDPRGPASDAVVISAKNGRGCITTTLSEAPGVAHWEIPVTSPLTLAGLPRLTLHYSTIASDLELNSRLWDVAPDGTQTLVTRGAYRAVAPKAGGDVADYQLWGNHWKFATGHRILLEVTQDDSSFFRTDNFSSTATITQARLTLPIR